MKSKAILSAIFILTFLAVLAWQTNTAKGQYVAVRGLISYWTFDEGTVDKNGMTVEDVWGRNDGVVEDDLIIVEGRIGEGLEFSGAGNHIDLIDFSHTDYSELSVEVWFKINELKSLRTMIAQDQGETSTGEFLNLYISDVPNQPVEARNMLHFGLRADNNITWKQASTSIKSIDQTEWHQVVGVYDGTKSLLYLDGILKAETEEFPICRDAENLVRIGLRASNQAQSGPFSGTLDEVRFYDQALSGAEVKGNFTAEGRLAVTTIGKLTLTWGEIKILR